MDRAGTIAALHGAGQPAYLAGQVQRRREIAGVLTHTGQRLQIEAAIRARPEVVACYAVTGDMDFLLHVFATDLASFSDFALKALLRMPGVKGTRSSFIMQAIKSDLAWAPAPRLR